MKQFEKILNIPPELRDRFNSFIVTEFDDSMTVEMQIRVLIKWIKSNIDLTNSMVNYLNEFIEKFDEKLYKTVFDVLTIWVKDGTLSELINDTLLAEINKNVSDINLKYNQLNEKVNKLGSNAPNGFYNTLEDLTNAKPTGDEKTYLVIEDGWLYVWKNVSWVKLLQYTLPSSDILESFDSRTNLFKNSRLVKGNTTDFKAYQIGESLGSKIDYIKSFDTSWLLLSNSTKKIGGFYQELIDFTDFVGHNLNFEVTTYSNYSNQKLELQLQFLNGETLVGERLVKLLDIQGGNITKTHKDVLLYPTNNAANFTRVLAVLLVTNNEIGSTKTNSVMFTNFKLEKKVIDDQGDIVYKYGNLVSNPQILNDISGYKNYTIGDASGSTLTRYYKYNKYWIRSRNNTNYRSGFTFMVDISAYLGDSLELFFDGIPQNTSGSTISIIPQILDVNLNVINSPSSTSKYVNYSSQETFSNIFTIPNDSKAKFVYFIILSETVEENSDTLFSNFLVRKRNYIAPAKEIRDVDELLTNGTFWENNSNNWLNYVGQMNLVKEIVPDVYGRKWLNLKGKPETFLQGVIKPLTKQVSGLIKVKALVKGSTMLRIGLAIRKANYETIIEYDSVIQLNDQNVNEFEYIFNVENMYQESSDKLNIFFTTYDTVDTNISITDISVKQYYPIKNNDINSKGLLNTNPNFNMGTRGYQKNGSGTILSVEQHNNLKCLRIKSDNLDTSLKGFQTSIIVDKHNVDQKYYVRFNLEAIKQSNFILSVQYTKQNGDLIEIVEPDSYTPMRIDRFQRYEFSFAKPNEAYYMIVYILGERKTEIDFLVNNFEISYYNEIFNTKYSSGGQNISELASSPRLPYLNLIGDTTGMTKDNPVKLSFEYHNHEEKISGYTEIKWQGSSSIAYPKKNYTIKLFKDINLTEKLNKKLQPNLPKYNKYVLKANYIDATHSRNNVCADLWGDMSLSRLGDPTLLNTTANQGSIAGYPIIVYINDEYKGIYCLNIGKDEPTWSMDKGNKNHIAISNESYFDASMFRSNTTDLDSEVEFSIEVGSLDIAQPALNRLLTFVNSSSDEDFKNNFSDYLYLNSVIDYYLLMNVVNACDNFGKNMLLITYDGEKWLTVPYDLDSTFSLHYNGQSLISDTTNWFGANQLGDLDNQNKLFIRTIKAFPEEFKKRYLELRSDVFTPKNISNMVLDFMSKIGQDNYNKDQELYNAIPSRTITNYMQIRTTVTKRIELMDNHYK